MLLPYGDCYDEEKMKIFRDCNIKICMCFADSWHIGKLKYFQIDKLWRQDIDESHIVLLDKIPKNFEAGRYGYKIYGRNDKAFSELIAKLFAEEGGG